MCCATIGASCHAASHIMKRDDLEAFFADPSAENYLRVHRRIRRYRRLPKAAQIARLDSLFCDRAFDQVREQADKLLPHWMLSPRLYRLSGLAAYELRDGEAAQIDSFLYQTCLQGLQATGSGQPESPFVVTYSSDIGELLEHLGFREMRRSLVRGPAGICEVVENTAGREIWFGLTAVDVPDVVTAMGLEDATQAPAPSAPAPGRTRRRTVSAR